MLKRTIALPQIIKRLGDFIERELNISYRTLIIYL